MPITEHQLEMRKRHIGASESSAILGVNPWMTAYDLWLRKTGKVPDEYSAGEAAGIGSMIENGLLDWGAEQIGSAIVKNQYRVHPNGILSATHDALVVRSGDAPCNVGLEAKTAGILNPFAAQDEWGEAESDDVPDRVIVQCQHQMAVSGLDLVHVPALIGGRGRVMFRVERSEGLVLRIEEACCSFWEHNVLADVPPALCLPTVALARTWKREPGKVVPLADALVDEWVRAGAMVKAAESAKNDAEARILAAMGDAEAGDCATARVKIIRGESHWLDAKALASDLPDVAEKYQRGKAYAYPRAVKLPKA